MTKSQTMTCEVCNGAFNWADMSRDNTDLCKPCAAQNKVQQAGVLSFVYMLLTNKIWWGSNRKGE